MEMSNASPEGTSNIMCHVVQSLGSKARNSHRSTIALYEHCAVVAIQDFVSWGRDNAPNHAVNVYLWECEEIR